MYFAFYNFRWYYYRKVLKAKKLFNSRCIEGMIHVNQWENDFLNFENELLFTRKKLNDLIYEYQNKGQNAQDDAIYQDKLHYLEIELQYINNQLQLLKRAQKEGNQASVSMQNPGIFQQTQNPESVHVISAPNSVQSLHNPTMTQTTQTFDERQIPQNANTTSTRKGNPYPTAPVPTARKSQDYEKFFGKNLMGIFASVLIFISLIIFATLILPHLTDALKMLAMYIASVAVLSAGLLLHRKNKDNLFYIAIIGCGAGSLYLSLLLSNMYFKVIGDLMLYILILVWAVFVKYLTRIKNLVFNIIGQAGIFIASVLGTILCVSGSDPQKYFVLSIFYFISAVVFSNIGKTYLLSLFRVGSRETFGENVGETAEVRKSPSYEDNLCTHICKTLNVIVYTIGFAGLTDSVYRHASYSGPLFLIVFNIFLFMGYLLLEYFFSYKEECKHGLAFQILSMVNAALLVCLFNEIDLGPDDWTYMFLYLVAIAALLYVEIKDAEYKMFSQIWCLIMVFIGCHYNSFIKDHLFAYLTVIPFMLVGYRKKDNIYLCAGAVYLATLSFSSWPYNNTGIEYLIMIAAMYTVFLYISRKTDQTWFKIAGYILLCFTTLEFVDEVSYKFMKDLSGLKLSTDYEQVKGLQNISTKSKLFTFFVLATVHLVLSKLEYFGKKKPVEIMMFGINALLMFAGCVFMYATDEMLWKLPVILITLLLFIINSKKTLPRHKYAGYYIAFKYTVLMLCILGSYDVVDYATSICLLVFAIISIVTGFYRDTIAFRLYGLILSMISIVKLIMIDIKYDSTIENAVSFFVSGVLCFVISFIYNRIDGKLRGK